MFDRLNPELAEKAPEPSPTTTTQLSQPDQQKTAKYDGIISHEPGSVQEIRHTPCVDKNVLGIIHGGIDGQSIDGDLPTRNRLALRNVFI